DHFLIVSTTGLGDTLLATPAIRALRETYPKAYIGCLTSFLGAEVLKDNPYLNELFVFNKVSSLLKLYFQLKKRKIGTALLFHTSQRAILPLCAVIGTSQRIGTAGLQKGLDSLLTQPIPWAFSHEIERRLEIVRAAGAIPQTYELDFIIEETHRKAAKELIPEGFVVGLHPGAKDRFKQWPPSHFVKVAKKLQQELQCAIVVTGSSTERQLVEALCAEIGQAQAIIEPLKVMAAVLEKLTLFITNDTGPLHLALSMNTPTIALFVPTNPAICGPYHNASAKVIQASPTCSPCLKKKCHDPFCMRQIGPDVVIQAALEQLKAYV
ncbi:MAG: glycosyltransferase family 9 protein, partial [Rhabdochlamydiaceae bacterium]